jgi:hypothetical protein
VPALAPDPPEPALAPDPPEPALPLDPPVPQALLSAQLELPLHAGRHSQPALNRIVKPRNRFTRITASMSQRGYRPRSEPSPDDDSQNPHQVNAPG